MIKAPGRHKFISFVKLVEEPTRDNGWFVIVENTAGSRFYVSKLFGAAAIGLPQGSKLKLKLSSSKSFQAYSLERA